MLNTVQVSEYMAKNLVTLSPSQEINSVMYLFAERGISGAPVVDDHGNLVGMLSDTDCMQAAIKAGHDPDWRGLVSDYMSHEVKTVNHDDSILEVSQRFLEDRFRRYPVVGDNSLVGQISRLDVLKALESMRKRN